MILLSSRKLEHALAGGKLESWSKVKYLILPTVLASLSGPFYIFLPASGKRLPTTAYNVSGLCSILVAYLTYWGIKRCYKTNSEIDGRAFFERFAILFVPPMMKLIIVVVPLWIVVLYGVLRIQDHAPHVFERVSYIASAVRLLAIFAMYTMLNNSFRRLGQIIESQE
jgi:hypothetical protein